MLRAAGGDWKQVELSIQKTREMEESRSVKGKRVTELDLQERKWTSDMIKKSKEWAKQRGLLRISEIHGAEEWELPLDFEFGSAVRNKET